MNFNNFTVVLKKDIKNNYYNLAVMKLSPDKSLNKSNRVVEVLGTISIRGNKFTFNLFRFIFWMSLNISVSAPVMRKLANFKIFTTRGSTYYTIDHDSTDTPSVADNKK